MCNYLCLDQWFRGMLFKDFSIFSSGGHFVWQSGTVNCAILVEQYGIHSFEIILNLDSSLGGDVILGKSSHKDGRTTDQSQ